MVYVVDVALAPVGLLAALAIDESPWYLTLMIPLFGVLAFFATERRTRLEQLTELNGAYRGTALVLAEVVDADDAYTGKHTPRRRRALGRGRSTSSTWTTGAGASSSSARCCTTSARSRSRTRS